MREPIFSCSAPWVYFIQAKSGGPIKIGKAANVRRRLKALQSASPEKLKILGATRVLSEPEVHRMFWKERIRGEWFEPSPALLRFIDAVREFRPCR